MHGIIKNQLSPKFPRINAREHNKKCAQLAAAFQGQGNGIGSIVANITYC